MPALFVFLFKVNIALLVFCAGYYLVLRHLTFYTLNRVYLITAIVFASIYPKIDLTAFAQRHEQIALPVQNIVLNWQAPAAKLVKPLEQPAYWQWVTLLFWLGVTLLAIRLMVQLFSLLKLYRKSQPANIMQHDVRVIQGDAAPFSFWRSIYVNPANHTAADLKAILLHEQVHVNGWHTIDILLAELSSIFYWFNPGVWLMKRAVRENIEFITDRKILNKGIDTKTYQYSLVNVSFNTTTPGIVNHFNISTIKKRIIMMNAKRSSRVNLTRYAFVVPAVALLLVFSFSKAAIVKKSGNAVKELTHTITDNFTRVMPATLVKTVKDVVKTPEGTEVKITATAIEEDNTGMVFYINGVKTGNDGPNFGDNTESLYFLNAAEAKKYFNAGDGVHRVAYAFTKGSPEGKALKDKLEKLIADNTIHADKLQPATIEKLNLQIHRLNDNIAAHSDTSTKQATFVYVNPSLLKDTLNYVLNGKKVGVADFKKIDPNTIVSINITDAADAKRMLNDYASFGFKEDSKIMFIATKDSPDGKKIADQLGNRRQLTNIRVIKGDNATLNGIQADTVIHSVITYDPRMAKISPDVQEVVVTGRPTVRAFTTRTDGVNQVTVSDHPSARAYVTRPGDVREVVVTGHPAKGLTYVTGDVATVNGVQVLPRKKMAGDVVEVRGMPSRTFSYSTNTVNRISDKLIIIDGKEATEKELKKLSAFDIDRMNVSSDSDTVKKYGDKARYGVVYIYTKKGK